MCLHATLLAKSSFSSRFVVLTTFGGDEVGDASKLLSIIRHTQFSCVVKHFFSRIYSCDSCKVESNTVEDGRRKLWEATCAAVTFSLPLGLQDTCHLLASPCHAPYDLSPMFTDVRMGLSPYVGFCHLQSIHVLERTASSGTEPSVSRQLLEPEPIPLSKVSDGVMALTGHPVWAVNSMDSWLS